MIVTQASSTSTVSTVTSIAIGSTATTFVTTTTTMAAVPTGACGLSLGSFAIQASYNSQYAVGGQGESSTVQFTSSSLSGAQYFDLDSNCVLVESTGTYALFQAEQDTGAYQYGEPVFFASTTRIGYEGFIPITCYIDSNYNLACTVQGNSINAADEGDSNTWNLYDKVSDAQADGSTQISVKAVSVPSS
jgi:hypothetical protein